MSARKKSRNGKWERLDYTAVRPRDYEYPVGRKMYREDRLSNERTLDFQRGVH